MSKLTVMISGHLDLTQAEFDKYYKRKLDMAIKMGCDFVIGDARGADVMAQEYLRDKGVSVTVYHPWYEGPRNNVGSYPVEYGYDSFTARDAAMTEASTKDIAWVRPGRSKSGTARNLARRKKLKKRLPPLTQLTLF